MTVGSVTKAVAILRHLARSRPQGVNAIARAVSVSPSSCFAILKTLVAEEFLEFDPAAKTYRLGEAPAHLFGAAADHDPCRQWLEEQLPGLAADYLVCLGLWRLRADRLELLHVADSPLDTRIHLTVGQRLPSHVGAMGRCIAAHEGLSREDLRQVLRGVRWQDAPSLADYERDVRAAARDGWACDEGHFLRGVTSVATAVADADGAIRYSLTASSFSGQLDRDGVARLGAQLSRLGRQAAALLRPAPPSHDARKTQALHRAKGEVIGSGEERNELARAAGRKS